VDDLSLLAGKARRAAPGFLNYYLHCFPKIFGTLTGLDWLGMRGDSDAKRAPLMCIQKLECLVAAILLMASVGMAQTPSDARPSPSGNQFARSFRRTPSRWSFGMQMGLALENNIPRNISHISLLLVQPSLAFSLHDFSSGKGPAERFQIVDEGLLGGSLHPGGKLMGNAVLFRIVRRNHGRLAPFLNFGAGMLRTSLDNRAPELSGPLQFMPQAGFGLEHFISPQRAIVFEYRYMHMSNAGLVPPNHGFNGDMITIGLRWLPRPHGALAISSRQGLLHFLQLK
jgi:Lipid A 3-O-deacylase (PagL)